MRSAQYILRYGGHGTRLGTSTHLLYHSFESNIIAYSFRVPIGHLNSSALTRKSGALDLKKCRTLTVIRHSDFPAPFSLNFLDFLGLDFLDEG